MKIVFPVLGLLLALLPGRSLWWAADAAEPAADHAPKLIAPAVSTGTGLLLEPSLTLPEFTQTVVTKLTGNANVPTLHPALSLVQLQLSAFNGSLAAKSVADAAALQATAVKNAARATLETSLTTEAATVETATGGDPAKILSTGMGVQSGPTQITSMDPVTEFAVTMGDAAGSLDWQCHRVARARSFNVRISPGSATGPWTMVPGSSRSKGELSGLASGTTVWVQVQAVGPNSLTSPWSNPAGSVVP